MERGSRGEIGTPTELASHIDPAALLGEPPLSSSRLYQSPNLVASLSWVSSSLRAPPPISPKALISPLLPLDVLNL